MLRSQIRRRRSILLGLHFIHIAQPQSLRHGRAFFFSLFPFLLTPPFLPFQNLLITPPSTPLTSPPPALACQLSPSFLPHFHPPYLAFCSAFHECPQRRERCANSPCWLPCFFVVAGDAEADLAIDFEAAGGVEETKGRGA